jgi:type II secretory pathway pseudopilin PulG
MRMKVPPSFVRTAQFILKALIRLLMAVLLIAFIAICVLSSKWALQASAVATIIMAAVTAAMAYYTQESVKEARVTRQEAEQLRKQLNFQRTLVQLAKEKKEYTRFYATHIQTGNIAQNPSALINDWNSLTFNSLIAVENLCEQLILPPELLNRLLDILNHLKRLRRQVEEISQGNFGLPNNVQGTALSILFFLTQLGCYCLSEAERQGFSELAKVFKDTGSFKPSPWLAGFQPQSSTVGGTFYHLPPEPDMYKECKADALVTQAKQQQVVAKSALKLPI